MVFAVVREEMILAWNEVGHEEWQAVKIRR